MGLMMVAGFTCCTLLGWPLLTSLFLGGMIAISSTTIIAKTFDELHLKDKGFAGLVFGVLVIQDIAAVFLMVVLSTLAVGTNIDGAAVSVKLGRMALYLIVWFVLTVIFVPVALQRIASFLTDEILLIASLALCLCMVALASAIGFSAALGAFLAGSILAGTVQAERIAKLVKPIKDLFGAVFSSP
nr:cation:proton antiporter [Slackia piriformis]